MNLSRSEILTTQFYEWEGRGRGWLVFDAPIDLEPPFRPFYFREPSRTHIDDGRRETIFTSLSSFFSPKPKPQIEEEEKEEPSAYTFSCDEPLKAFKVISPKGEKVRIEQVEELLLVLSDCEFPISFEIVANHRSISIQVVVREPDAFFAYSQLKAFFPTATIKDASDTAFDIVKENAPVAIIDYGLSEEFMRPLSMPKNIDIDPLTGTFGILENLGEEEQACIQFLFKSAINPWAESIINSVTDNRGDSFFADAPEMLPLATDKISRPLFAVSIRCIGQSHTVDSSIALSQRLGNTLCLASRSQGNILIPLSGDGYDFEEHIVDVVLRQTHRLGMLLNSLELANLVHPPSPSVAASKVEREAKKTKRAPEHTKDHGYILGVNEHQGVSRTVSIGQAERLRHMYMVGATGTGKSTFLLNCIVQDIHNGNGFAVLDPHGDLIDHVLNHIPEKRYGDVILIDPSDTEYPVGFNILKAHSDIEKDILSSDLVGVFRRLSTSWGDQMNSVLANAILAFLESTQAGTLIDLRRFLVEKSFRDEWLKSVTDPSIVYYWKKEYPLLKSNSIGSILTRLDTFLRPKVIRNMVAQEKSLDFEDILDSGKILLMKLSQGLIGNENSYLLGTFMVAKIQQAAMARQAKAKEHRSDFYVYIDEFQNFITPSMETILSGTRKYHLGLILAHQDMQQLLKVDAELASSVISNPATRVCFRVGDIDAKRFEAGFSSFEAKDLQNLGLGEAIARIDRPEFDFNLSITPLPEADKDIAEERQNTIIALSRKAHGTPKAEVEASLFTLHDEVPEKEEKPIATKEPPKVEVLNSPEKTTEEDAVIDDTETRKQLRERKEESEHRYLQSLIKRMAESRGYRVSVEEATPDGKGRVDVVLHRNDKRIACEICVTTSTAWEMHNITKCIEAGYDVVVECSKEQRVLDIVAQKVQGLDEAVRSKIFCYTPEQLFLFLDKEVAKEASTEVRVKGYRVKVEYGAVSDNELKSKKDAIIKNVTDAKRKK